MCNKGELVRGVELVGECENYIWRRGERIGVIQIF